MLVLHIGYAKTGTTSLQKHFFPKLENVIYLGRTYPVPKVITGSIFNNLLGLFNKIKFDSLAETLPCYIHDDSEKLRDYINQLNLAIQKMPKEKIKLFSHETLLRSAYWSRTARRIQEIFQGMDVKIVFTIRRQQELIMSRLNHDKFFFDLKREDLKMNFSDNLLNCIYPVCSKLTKNKCHQNCAGRKKLSLPYYDFDMVISKFEEVFGRDNIEVLCFEKLFKSDTDHNKRLAGLLNADEEIISNLIQRIPHANKAKDPEEYSQFKARFQHECSSYLADYYRESNAELSKRYGLGLEDVGYY